MSRNSINLRWKSVCQYDFTGGIIGLVIFGIAFSQPITEASDKNSRLQNEVSQLSIDQLRSRILLSQQRIVSVYIEYLSRDAYAEERRFPTGTFLRRIVAAKNPCFFSHETAHGFDEMTWEDDIRRRLCCVDRDRVYDVWINNRTYNLTEPWAADAPLPGSMPGEPVMLVMALWPMNDRPAPRDQGHPIMLVDVARDTGYRLADQNEIVDGNEAYVLVKDGVDRLWIDVNRDCALLARERHDVKTGKLFLRYELTGHREVAEGIWLPNAFRILRYRSNSDDLPLVVSDQRFDIAKLRVNDLDDSFFNYELPPGSLQLNPADESGQPVQTVPGGVEHMENLVAWIERQGVANRPDWGTRFLWFIAIVSILSAGGVGWWHGRMRATR